MHKCTTAPRVTKNNDFKRMICFKMWNHVKIAGVCMVLAGPSTLGVFGVPKFSVHPMLDLSKTYAHFPRSGMLEETNPGDQLASKVRWQL